MENNSAVRFEGVNKSFGSKKVLSDLSFEISKGQIYCLIGESGSGKTTALRLMNGMIEATQGNIELDGEAIAEQDKVSLRRKMGYAIQGSGLFPHMSVLDNISLVAKKMGWSQERILERAKELLELVNLPPGQYLQRKPRQMSGGQQQRVGIIRALFMRPSLILMDEPFGALDPLTRDEVQDEFLAMQKKLGFTAVIVTHDIAEAFKLSHKVMLLRHGQIAQVGKPAEFLNRPATGYVKEFVSSHAPTKVLQSVFVYSVMNDDVWSTYKKENTWKIKNVSSNEEHIFQNPSDLVKKHEELGQKYVYLCSGEKLEKVYRSAEFEKQEGVEISPLLQTDHIGVAIKRFVETKHDIVPVLDSSRFFKGVFSREVINELA